MYEDGLKAYDDDDMDKLAELISKLNENPTKYPTKQDIEELTEKFDSREKEISKTDNAISEIEKLLANSDDNLVSTEIKTKKSNLLQHLLLYHQRRYLPQHLPKGLKHSKQT